MSIWSFRVTLIDDTMSGWDSCMLEEYVNGDNDLPVCADLDSDTRDAAFLSNLVEDGDKDQDGKDVDNHKDTIDNHPPPPKDKS